MLGPDIRIEIRIDVKNSQGSEFFSRIPEAAAALLIHIEYLSFSIDPKNSNGGVVEAELGETQGLLQLLAPGDIHQHPVKDDGVVFLMRNGVAGEPDFLAGWLDESAFIMPGNDFIHGFANRAGETIDFIVGDTGK